jgi:hypothetical protein
MRTEWTEDKIRDLKQVLVKSNNSAALTLIIDKPEDRYAFKTVN